MSELTHIPVIRDVIDANAAELTHTAEYLLSAMERIRTLPPAQQVGTLVGICGVAADRITHAVKRLKGKP